MFTRIMSRGKMVVVELPTMRPPRNFALRHQVGDALSRVVSALLRELRHEDERIGDVKAFGAPSECVGDACLVTGARCAEIIRAAGYTPDAVDFMLTERVSAKWIYASGIGHAIAAADEYENRRSGR